MGNPELLFSVGNGSLGPLLESFQADFPASRGPPQSETATYLDTTDRRIMATGGTFEAVPGLAGVDLHWKHRGTNLRARSGNRPQSARNLPAGPMREGLSALIATRRLVPLVVVERKVEELDLCDEEEKTTARLRVVTRRARTSESRGRWHELPTVIHARGVRGYSSVFADLAGWLRVRPELQPHGQAELEEALEAVGRLLIPEKVQLEYAPDQPALEAVREASRLELEAWIAKCKAVRADLEPESLHEARVALRRARTILRQMRAVLPPSASRDLVQELRWLASESGSQRDLDVFLEDLETLEHSLPQTVVATLEELRTFVREEREAARSRLLAVLDGDRHGALLTAWRDFVDGSVSAGDAPGARDTLLVVLMKRLRKRDERLLEAGQRLGLDPLPNALHELRIECKKLRYLLDAFQSLFPPDPVAALLDALKELQDVLGRANDSRRQSEILQELAERFHAAGRASAACLLAAGQVLVELERRRAQATQGSLRIFRSFADRRELVEGLLDGPGNER